MKKREDSTTPVGVRIPKKLLWEAMKNVGWERRFASFSELVRYVLNSWLGEKHDE